MIVLGIETSCDETAAAIVTNQRVILSNKVLSQMQEHAPYGGVVPEIAARSHVEHLDGLIEEALAEANIGLDDLDGIAVTGGPGLIGGVIVGVMTAKALASVCNKPLIAVNHLEGHALTARLTDTHLEFPFLLLLVSGGHCQFLAVEDVGKYTLLGTTLDDALGEAYDKTAKMLGLPYPGGPQIEALAKQGDPASFELPMPLKGREGCDLSFSGLKTAVRQIVDRFEDHQGDEQAYLSDKVREDICASFQHVCGDILDERATHAIARFREEWPTGRSMVIAGGVAANHYLRLRVGKVADQGGLSMRAAPIELCTDNAAMIAWAGIERLQRGLIDTLDFSPRARWPLEEVRWA